MFAAVGSSDGVYLNQKLADDGLAEALVGHLDVGVCVVDSDLNVVTINGLARKILGFPADLIRQGLTLEVLIRFNAARGDFGEGNVDDLVRERLELARTVEADAFEFTQEDGSVVQVRRTLLSSGGFITTYSGNPAVKQSDEKDFEAALARLQDVFETMEQGVILWNSKQCCEMVNLRTFEMLDLDESYLRIGMPRSEFLERSSKRGDLSEEQLRLVTKSFTLGDKFRFDRVTPSGRTVTTDVQPRPDGGFIVTFSDVTDIRKREAEYIVDRNSAQQDAKKYLNLLTHLDQEIQSPVKDLIGKAELLAKGELDDKQQFLAQTVIKSGHTLQATIGDVLGKTGDLDIAQTDDGEATKVAVVAGAALSGVHHLIATSVADSSCRPEEQLPETGPSEELTEAEPKEVLAEPKEQLAEAGEKQPVQPWSGEVTKVLIAEDNDANQEVFLELLEGDAYEITSVMDGREAVVQYIADSAKFDVIVMDLTMPVMGGVPATEAIRAHEKVRNAPKIPIIGVSAFATDEHREQAQLAGMNEYLTKPLNVERFLECLTQCASDRRVQDLKGKAEEMASVSSIEDDDQPLSIADLARKYQQI